MGKAATSGETYLFSWERIRLYVSSSSEWNSWCEGIVKRLPFIPGHECSGDVVTVGNQVKLFTEKDGVSVETHLPCGRCFQCRNGQSNICQNMELFGHIFNGCSAEYCNVPETIVEKVPDCV